MARREARPTAHRPVQSHGLSSRLGMEVIAEGVENESQMSFLRAHHCDEIQGYYYSRPLTVDELFAKLRSIATKSTSAGEPLLGATKEMS